MQGTFSERELARWNWAAVIEGAAAGRITGFPAEADRELRNRYFSNSIDTTSRQIASPHAFLVPNEVLRRDLTVAGTGGYLVATDQVGFLDALAPMMVTAKLGATRLPGLVGNVTIPRMTATSTAYWLSGEGAPITESQPTFGQVALVPKAVGAYSEFSRQLLLQSAPAVNKVVARELARRVAVAIDAAAINGSGGAEPLGILNTENIGTFTGTSLDLAALVTAQSALAGEDVDAAQAAYCTTPDVAALLMGRQKFTNSDSALWTGPLGDGNLAGLRAIASTQVPGDTAICGVWEHLYLGEWGAPLEVTVNPYANFATGIIGMRCLALVDCAVAHVGGFAAATSIS